MDPDTYRDLADRVRERLEEGEWDFAMFFEREDLKVIHTDEHKIVLGRATPMEMTNMAKQLRELVDE